MEHTVTLKQNHEFRRLYAKGKSAVAPSMAIYCRKNRFGINRIGFTTGTKLGNAVVRNRIRRRLREVYRTNEAGIRTGYDIVGVARVRAGHSRYRELERQFLQTADKLGLLLPGGEQA